jgi:hypothetical protein
MPESRARPTFYTVTLVCGAAGPESYLVHSSSKKAAVKQALRHAGRLCTVLEVIEGPGVRDV